LTAPEMTVLVGGMRALNANQGQSKHGVFTDRPDTLTNDFFVNLLDMGTAWRPSVSDKNVYEGRDRTTGKTKWTATAADVEPGATVDLHVYRVRPSGNMVRPSRKTFSCNTFRCRRWAMAMKQWQNWGMLLLGICPCRSTRGTS